MIGFGCANLVRYQSREAITMQELKEASRLFKIWKTIGLGEATSKIIKNEGQLEV